MWGVKPALPVSHFSSVGEKGAASSSVGHRNTGTPILYNCELCGETVVSSEGVKTHIESNHG